MKAYENRIINGLLKSKVRLELSTPEQVQSLLHLDIEVTLDPARCEELWPCVWALASVLERQFSGSIYINCGLNAPLPGPSILGSRIIFGRPVSTNVFAIGIGVENKHRRFDLTGDVRGNQISCGRILQRESKAHPIGCFALAGYLGYSALAHIVGLDPFNQSFAKDSLEFAFASEPTEWPASLVFIGLGQLGQAYLALLFFLDQARSCAIHLLDKDPFELPNRTTQILLPEITDWEGTAKAKYLKDRFSNLGWNATSERHCINWGWQKLDSHAPFALLGLDKFDPRRMVIAAGYEWLFEAGIGTSFVAPKISWHSFPGRPEFAKLFPPDPIPTAPPQPTSEFENALMHNTPGGCGWVSYNSVSASAPSMGLVAAAYVWTEVLNHTQKATPVRGVARLWSPLLPYTREEVLIT